MKKNQLIAFGLVALVIIIVIALVQSRLTEKPQEGDDIDWTVAADSSSLGNDYLDETASVTLTYEHVVPGEYSELYATVVGRPGSYVKAEIYGPGIPVQQEQSMAQIGEEGYVVLTRRITQYGNYEAIIDYENANYSERELRDTITVE